MQMLTSLNITRFSGKHTPGVKPVRHKGHIFSEQIAIDSDYILTLAKRTSPSSFYTEEKCDLRKIL